MAYSIVDGMLNRARAGISAAEAHGVAVGMLCIDRSTEFEGWLAGIADDESVVSGDDRQTLARLFAETRRLLAGDQFEFGLFLPDEQAPLNEQAGALAAWCQGFLFGLGARRVSPELSAEARDIIKDIAEFTRLDSDAEGEDDEAALTEIVEYLRSAVLLLREELNTEADAAGRKI